MRFGDRDVLTIVNSALSDLVKDKVSIEYVPRNLSPLRVEGDYDEQPALRFGDKIVFYGRHDILAPSGYYKEVLLDSRNAEPRGEIWKIYDGFLRSVNVFRNQSFATRRFGHGMHFDEDHDYFQNYCHEFFSGHMEQAMIHETIPLLKRYRDHAAHACRVGALGWFLLSRYLRKSQISGPILRRYCKTRDWCWNELKMVWWITSLLHDIGYLWEELFRLLNGNTSDTEFVKTLARYILADEYLYFLTTNSYQPGLAHNPAMLKQRAEEVFRAKSEILELKGRDWWYHEELSAVLLNLHQEGFGIPGDGSSKAIANLAEVSRIISEHHGLSEIQFESDPLSFLLILCDEAQEWGRPIKTRHRIWACEIENVQLHMSDDNIEILLDYPDKHILGITAFDVEKAAAEKEQVHKRLSAPFKFSIRLHFPPQDIQTTFAK